MKQQMLFSDLHVHDSLFKCESSLIKLLLLIVEEESHNMLSWFCHTSMLSRLTVVQTKNQLKSFVFLHFFMIKMLLKVILKRLLLNCVHMF